MTEPGVGHNSKTKLAKEQLLAFIERVERLEADKDSTSSDIRDVYAESKANGFDVAALRTIVKLRKKDKDELTEAKAILDTYLDAIGMSYLL